ncbi:hypothetical protein SEEM841_02492 [Salmonella enterica subsp. enterica serovar Senftenberg str. 423984-1]|nr:hypothetical protein SEEM841_02492 [Salmonella enterica subsp. enterica serovar Senftenberg str. 423984-1]
MVDLPLLSAPSLQQQLVGHPSANMTLEQLERMSAEQKSENGTGGSGPVYQLLRCPGRSGLYPPGGKTGQEAGIVTVLAEW